MKTPACLYPVKIRMAIVCNYCLVPMYILSYCICHDNESLLFGKAVIWFRSEYILYGRESIFNFNSSTCCFVLFTYFFRTKLFYLPQPLECHFPLEIIAFSELPEYMRYWWPFVFSKSAILINFQRKRVT